MNKREQLTSSILSFMKSAHNEQDLLTLLNTHMLCTRQGSGLTGNDVEDCIKVAFSTLNCEKFLENSYSQEELSFFVNSYISAALFSTTDESDPQGGDPFDQNYTFDDIAPSALELINQTCKLFLDKTYSFLKTDLEQAGMDFWFTSAGHGAGFWDGDWGEKGETLTSISEQFKCPDIYLGDDGLIYFSGGLKDT